MKHTKLTEDQKYNSLIEDMRNQVESFTGDKTRILKAVLYLEHYKHPFPKEYTILPGRVTGRVFGFVRFLRRRFKNGFTTVEFNYILHIASQMKAP